MNIRLLCLILLLSTAPVLAEDDDRTAHADESDESTEPATQTEAVSMEEIRRFVSVFRAVQHAYVEPVDDKRLMQAAIRGLLLDLDPHSAYLDQEATATLSEQASGAYGGLGLEVIQRPDRVLMVVSPIDETPAARAGIRSGDLIVAIDGKPIEAENQSSAVELMRGPPGSGVSITIMREGEPKPLEFALVRETIRVASVRERTLEPGYVYLRIAAFQADTAGELKRKLSKTVEGMGETGLKGIVLDLRSNPGGLLNAGIEVADAFIEKGLLLSTRGRLPFTSSEYQAKPGDIAQGAPIVVLTDSGTASAAEVVAGALRDHRRALIMGGVSFGKGSVQTVLPVDNGDSIKLTTARYYTPNGTSIQASGIVPDILLDDDIELRRGVSRGPVVRESDLAGHLDNESAAPGVIQAEPLSEPVADYAVLEALNLLKGLALFSAPPKPVEG